MMAQMTPIILQNNKLKAHAAAHMSLLASWIASLLLAGRVGPFASLPLVNLSPTQQGVNTEPW